MHLKIIHDSQPLIRNDGHQIRTDIMKVLPTSRNAHSFSNYRLEFVSPAFETVPGTCQRNISQMNPGNINYNLEIVINLP